MMFSQQGDFLMNGKTVLNYSGNSGAVEIPEGTEHIAMAAFYAHAEIETIVLPESLLTIGKFAFAECAKLRSLKLPAHLEKIANDAFDACWGMREFNVAEGNGFFKQMDGVLYNRDMSRLIRYPIGSLEEKFVIPKNVKEIDDNAFNRARWLKKVVLPEGVTQIGYKAFCYAGLETADLPASIENICYGAFSNCTRLKSIALRRSDVYKIDGQGALVSFDGSSLIQLPGGSTIKEFVLPKEVSQIQDRALTNCQSLEYICSNGNETFSDIDGVLFNKDKTLLLAHPMGKISERYEIPPAVTEIYGSSFQGCNKIDTVIASNNLTKISRHAFEGSSLRRFLPGPAFKKIGWGSFAKCDNLDFADFSNTQLEFVNGLAFFQCKNLKAVVLPDSVKKIVRWAFSECISLKSLSFSGNITKVFIEGFDARMHEDELRMIMDEVTF